MDGNKNLFHTAATVWNRVCRPFYRCSKRGDILPAEIGAVTFAGKVSGVELYFGWVRGAEMLDSLMKRCSTKKLKIS